MIIQEIQGQNIGSYSNPYMLGFEGLLLGFAQGVQRKYKKVETLLRQDPIPCKQFAKIWKSTNYRTIYTITSPIRNNLSVEKQKR